MCESVTVRPLASFSSALLSSFSKFVFLGTRYIVCMFRTICVNGILFYFAKHVSKVHFVELYAPLCIALILACITLPGVSPGCINDRFAVLNALSPDANE